MPFLIPGYQYFQTFEKRTLLYPAIELTLGAIYGVYYYRGRVTINYARSLAFEKSGIALPSKYTQDWRLVEAYYSYEEYVEYLYRVARQIYPDDPAKQDQYVKERLPKQKWYWNDLNSYYTFQSQLRYYRELDSRKTIVLGVILLNHLASGIDHLVSAELKARTGLNVETRTVFRPEGFDFRILFNY